MFKGRALFYVKFLDYKGDIKIFLGQFWGNRN